MNDWVDAEEELTKELCFRGTEMTNDRELLELAATAVGKSAHAKTHFTLWNPLTDDGDALRLAVNLGLFETGQLWDKVMGYRFEYDGDPCAATRRAIVRAAAEIGKGLK